MGVSRLFSKSIDVRVDREFRDSKGSILELLVKTPLDFGDFPVILGGYFSQPLDAFLGKIKPGISRPVVSVKGRCGYRFSFQPSKNTPDSIH